MRKRQTSPAIKRAGLVLFLIAADLIGRTRAPCPTRVKRPARICRCTRVGCGTRVHIIAAGIYRRTRCGGVSGATGRSRARVPCPAWIVGAARTGSTRIGRTGTCSTRVGTARRCCARVISGARIGSARVRSARVPGTWIAPRRRFICRVADCGWIGGGIGVIEMIKRHRAAGREENRAKQDCIFFAHDFLNPSMPNTGRSAIPIQLPAKAATNQSQPCTLPDAMPLKNAPILQPNARRAP